MGLPALLIATGAWLHLAAARIESLAASPYPVGRTFTFRGPSPLPSGDAGVVPATASKLPVPLFLERGETLGGKLQGLGLEPVQVGAVIEELAPFVDPRRLRPGDGYVAYLDEGSKMAALDLTLEGKGRVHLERDGASWRTEWHAFERRVEVRSLDGTLDGSLEEAIRGAGGEPTLAYRMADALQWDLDFNRDLRRGDRFQVLYQQVYLEGEPSGVGAVLALAYENRGKLLEAYRFGDSPGYYDGQGRPLQKLFLKSPLPYSRVTSRFSQRRFHPVLKSYRPHYGVDYGAPVGTPVRVTANGVVAFAGWDKGGGRTIKVRHPNGYLTAYLHLSRFASGVASGRRVSQGEVIGYVGATGLATGPHLDYRVQVKGRWIDPLSLRSVPSDPISPQDLPLFLAQRDEYRALLAHGAAPPPAAGSGPGDRVATRPEVPAPGERRLAVR